MLIVTSVSLFKTAAGQRMSVTYSEINENGEIVKENIKVTRIINKDKEAILNHIDEVLSDAQDIVDSLQE